MSTITVNKYQFHISDPYQPNQVLTLTENEAAVMNTARSEYIRNQAFKWIEEEKSRQGVSILSPETLTQFQQRITELDARFEFAPRKTRQSALERTLNQVALELVNKQLIEPAPLSQLILHPSVQLEARRRLENNDRAILLIIKSFTESKELADG